MINDIAIAKIEGKIRYPSSAPFNPPQKYKELTINTQVDKQNTTYPLIRKLFYEMGYDKANYGTSKWNPLGEIIKKGDKVVIKPNWVLDKSQYDINALITNMSVIRAVIDYAWIACGPKGKISILESPIQGTDWQNLMKVTGAQETITYLKSLGINIDLQDIRTECFIEKNIISIFGWKFKYFYRKKLPGTKRGYVKINLGNSSSLELIKDKYKKFRGIQKWTEKETLKAHNYKDHIYSVPKEILDCDVFINMPKLKTHRKAGVTLALKNLVGMVNTKDWLPHYIEGTPQKGGDEAPGERQMYVRIIDAVSIVQFFKKFGFSIRPPGIEKIWRKKIESDLHKLKNVRQANWYGGDTVWRMVYDLNMILFYADKKGKMRDTRQRKYLSIIDGIISGEKFGPLDSLPKNTGIVLMGEDPIFLEYIGARIMGFDDRKIKTLTNIHTVRKYPFSSGNFGKINIKSDDKKWSLLLTDPKKVSLKFIPAPGWENYIELK